MKENFSKLKYSLVPAIIQDSKTQKVLMLGNMNEESFEKTREEKRVTFFSRSRNRLWTKGEESGNFLYVEDIKMDCDNDAILVKVKPTGPVCHTGADTCFNESNIAENFLFFLEQIIDERIQNPSDNSYTSKLFSKGINKIAQKVGEEATELIIEAKDNNNDNFKNEAADLIYHFLVLLAAKSVSLDEVISVLKNRHR